MSATALKLLRREVYAARPDALSVVAACRAAVFGSSDPSALRGWSDAGASDKLLNDACAVLWDWLRARDWRPGVDVAFVKGWHDAISDYLVVEEFEAPAVFVSPALDRLAPRMGGA